MVRSGETLGLLTGNKAGHNEHFLKFSALYYFFPFQNLKFLDYKEILNRYNEILEHYSEIVDRYNGRQTVITKYNTAITR